MAIDVLAFGIAREIAGNAVITVAMSDSTTVAELRENIEIQYPRLRQLASYMIAVNGVYANDNTVIKYGDEVAVIPPVSGG